ncbi:MAG: rhodanese-like domain-containing protein [Candidatus Bathyarchaeia archaeon]
MSLILVSDVPSINPKQVKEKFDERSDFILLDVREDNEVAFCRIEGSTHISVSSFQSQFMNLPKDREIIVYCHTGMRSSMVTSFLLQQGFQKVSNMYGGIDLWSLEIDSKVPRYT